MDPQADGNLRHRLTPLVRSGQNLRKGRAPSKLLDDGEREVVAHAATMDKLNSYVNSY